GEGRGELTLFFDKAESEEARVNFEDYVELHLQRKALSESITQRRIFVCSNCAEPLTKGQVTHRKERGYNWIDCPVCGERISLLDREERPTAARSSRVLEMDRAA